MIIEKCDPKCIYKLFPKFDRRFRIKGNYMLYVLFDENKPVSCLCIALEGKKYAKIHASYTPSELRKRGYFKMLLKSVVVLYKDKTIKADCLPASFGVFSECGFEFLEKKYCKNYTLYKTIKRSDNNGSSAKGD